MFDQLPTDSSRLVIKGARVVDPSQNLDAVCNVFLVGGRIAGLSAEDIPDAEAVDARGLVCAPGLVDMHVHLRGSGGGRHFACLYAQHRAGAGRSGGYR